MASQPINEVEFAAHDALMVQIITQKLKFSKWKILFFFFKISILFGLKNLVSFYL